MSDLFDRMWREARELDEFDYRVLAKLGCSEDTAKRYIYLWRGDGRIRVSRVGAHGKAYYRAADRPPAGPQPVSGDATPEGNMWRAMRHLRQFSPTDIAAHANVGGVEITVDKARAYCRQLLASDHLKARRTAIPGRREALYQIVEDTGPRAPRTVRVAGVLDPNTGTFVPCRGVTS